MHGESTLTKEEITALLKLDGLVWSSGVTRHGSSEGKFMVSIYDFLDIAKGVRGGYRILGSGNTIEEALRIAFRRHNNSHYRMWKEKYARR
jgi:hypothetical protein